MKQISLLLTSFLIGTMVIAQTANEIAIIPEPVSLEKKNAKFLLSGQTKIVADAKNADATAQPSDDPENPRYDSWLPG